MARAQVQRKMAEPLEIASEQRDICLASKLTDFGGNRERDRRPEAFAGDGEESGPGGRGKACLPSKSE